MTNRPYIIRAVVLHDIPVKAQTRRQAISRAIDKLDNNNHEFTLVTTEVVK